MDILQKLHTCNGNFRLGKLKFKWSRLIYKEHFYRIYINILSKSNSIGLCLFWWNSNLFMNSVLQLIRINILYFVSLCNHRPTEHSQLFPIILTTQRKEGRKVKVKHLFFLRKHEHIALCVSSFVTSFSSGLLVGKW